MQQYSIKLIPEQHLQIEVSPTVKNINECFNMRNTDILDNLQLHN